MLVSVIIPNWNGAAHLPACLDSLRAQTFRNFEIIVADNASADHSLALLAARYPEVRVIALDRNYGFAGACNAGLRAAKGEIQILLNNDTETDPNWLAEVVSAFERHPRAGMIASKMLLFDRRDTLHTSGDLYGRDGVPKNRGVWEKDDGQYGEGPVFSACGGSAAYRKIMLDQIGLLDEDFFFSCEDVDLAWRAQLAGWSAVYAPKAVVYHKLSATGGGVTASFHDGRNFIFLLVKDVPGVVWRKHWREIIGAQWRIAWEALRAWRGAAARARLRGQLAGVLALPMLLKKRKQTQATRRVSDEHIESVLS
ncbi:MAG: glycosyltransferase family 2 protein [Chloroflexi bacterium]|nr:glycosyltransferase family 2 protein [Chloroflexota bacterium]